MKLKEVTKRLDWYLLASFLVGLVPALFIIHIIAVDFSGFYFEAVSFLKYHGYSYQFISNYCETPLNSGLNARAPLVPFVMSLSIGIFGQTLLGIYLPFFLVRICIVPVMYLVSKFFLPRPFAFLASIFILIVPKLQTYSFASFEADSYIALFYTLGMYFYLKSNKLQNKYYVLAAGAMLGLGSLAKSIGLSIALGFFAAIIIDIILSKKKFQIKNGIILLLSFLLFIGPYLFWTVFVHHQLYITTQHDKSLSYITINLPSLLYTIPIYLGVDFNLGIKGVTVSFVIFLLFLLGVVWSLVKKQFILVFPTLLTLLAISMLSTCLIGYNIPGNFEFISILGFSMIPSLILLFIGYKKSIEFVWIRISKNQMPGIIYILCFLLLLYKFSHNFFSSPYALDYIASEYYISFPIVIKYREKLPDVTFTVKNDLRLYTGPAIHKEIRSQLDSYRFKPFSTFYTRLVTLALGLAFILFIIGILKEPIGKPKRKTTLKQ